MRIVFIVLALLIAGFQCQSFRGGSISWSVGDNSRTVSFQVTTYWANSGVKTLLPVSFGDSTPQKTVTFSVIGQPTEEYTTVGGTVTYTYPKDGTFTFSMSSCCRPTGLKAPTTASAFQLTTTVKLDGVAATSPVLSLPPIIELGIGDNQFPVFSTLPGKFSWSESTLSRLGYPSPFIFASQFAPGPQLKAVNNNPNIALIDWKTGTNDAGGSGLWAAQLKVVTNTGVTAVSDFLFRVNSYQVAGNLPTIQVSTDSTYLAYVNGETASFTVVCDSPAAGALITLSVPSLPSNSFYMNGQNVAAVNITAGTPVAISWAPTITNDGANNQQWVLTFTCRSVATYLSASKALTISVGDPLVLHVPPAAYLTCNPSCKCIPASETGSATATDGCCGDPVISYIDGPSGSCNSQMVRTWHAWNQCGQNASKEQIIYINDNIEPTFTYFPEDFTAMCYEAIHNPQNELPHYTDNCDPQSTYLIVPPEDVATNGTANCNNVVTRTYTIVDQCGNKASRQQTITINDPSPPSIYKIVDDTFSLTVECPSEIGAFDNFVIATDDCSWDIAVEFSDYPIDIKCGKFTRHYWAKDPCGNIGTLDQEFEITHTQPPTMEFPKYQTPQCYAEVDQVPGPFGRSYCLNKLEPEFLSVTPILDGKCYKQAVRNWKVVDECGIETTESQNINIEDTTAPIIKLPADSERECVYGDHVKDYSGQVVDSYGPGFNGYASATDNCGLEPELSYTDSISVETCHSIISRSWLAIDECGNVNNATQLIKIVDTTPPEFSAPPDYVGQCWPDRKNALSPSDFSDCHMPVNMLTEDHGKNPEGKCNNAQYTRVFTIDDGCGNFVNHTQKVTIKDTIPPEIHVPSDTEVDCILKALPNVTGTATGTDNCGHVCVPEYTDEIWKDGNGLTRTWTICDGCHNCVTGKQKIHFNNNRPWLQCPNNTNVYCLDELPTASATAADDCVGNINVTHTQTIEPGCPTVVTRVFTAFNPITDKSSSCTQTITVSKPDGPKITPPVDTQVQCEFQARPRITGGACAEPVCVEDVVKAPNFTDKWQGQKCTSSRQVKRTWASSDQCGVSSSVTQTISVYDTINPIVTAPKGSVVTCRLNISVELLGKATATDNCDADGNPLLITFGDSGTPSTKYCPSSIIRTWTATDCTGNSASATQVITIDEAAPEFIGNPPAVLEDVQCPTDFTPPPLKARDSCGNLINAVPKITSQGTCPTLFTVTWTATDDCGRTSTFVQTGRANDTIAPILTAYDVADVTVECLDEVPTTGQVTVKDNCDAAIKPTFSDKFNNPDCTCDGCLQYIVRTWTAKDKCGNVANPISQTITIQKTGDPTIVVPPDQTVQCGQPTTPDNSGTGKATATDSCGNKLFVSFSDFTVQNEDGSYIIYRTWNTTDGCGHYASAVQKITVGLGGTTIEIPPNAELPCGGDTSTYSTGVATATSACGPVKISYVDSECVNTAPGLFIRTWYAKRNEAVVASGAQSIYTHDCDPSGNGISNVPTGNLLLDPSRPEQTTVTPKILINDLDLPCEILTFTWTWGDGTSDQLICNPLVTDSRCKFTTLPDGHLNVETSHTHTYYKAGSYVIDLLVTDVRAQVPSPLGDDFNGDGWVRFQVPVNIIDPYQGYISGNVGLNYVSESDSAYVNFPCVKPWVVKTLSYPATEGYASPSSCGGAPRVVFNAMFFTDGDGIYVNGDNHFRWLDCANIQFQSVNISHMSLFADGKSALYTGFGVYSPLKEFGALPFYAYVVDGQGSDIYYWIRIQDLQGNVVFDTAPCMPEITDITVQPPNPYTSFVGNLQLDVHNPTDTLVSALTDEDAGVYANIPIGLVVGITAGIVVFIIVVAVIVYFLLKTGQTATSGDTSNKFNIM